MADEKKPAPAVKKDVADDKPITGVRLISIRNGAIDAPALIYRGKAPKIGTKQRYKFDNGTVYSGIVADCTEADGEVLVEFRHGLTAEPKPKVEIRFEPDAGPFGIVVEPEPEPDLDRDKALKPKIIPEH